MNKRALRRARLHGRPIALNVYVGRVWKWGSNYLKITSV